LAEIEKIKEESDSNVITISLPTKPGSDLASKPPSASASRRI
jgi:hypothetical protein